MLRRGEPRWGSWLPPGVNLTLQRVLPGSDSLGRKPQEVTETDHCESLSGRLM